MREIKFRCWDPIDEVMIYPPSFDPIFIDLDGKVCKSVNEDNEDIEKNTAETLLLSFLEITQYTGLKDCTGLEVWEGDIIKYYVPDTTRIPCELISSIIFESGSFICLKMNEEILTLNEAIKISNKNVVGYLGIKVIGDVFQNPELLTK